LSEPEPSEPEPEPEPHRVTALAPIKRCGSGSGSATLKNTRYIKSWDSPVARNKFSLSMKEKPNGICHHIRMLALIWTGSFLVSYFLGLLTFFN
jgi:hypothetical protein